MSANDRQIGGTHYENSIQHWDWVDSNNLDYFQGQITMYVGRWKNKNGIEDLGKAAHFLEKYIELQGYDMHKLLEDLNARGQGVLNFREKHKAKEQEHPFGYDSEIDNN